MFGWLSRAFTKVKNFIASILFRVLSFFGLFKTQPTLHELYRVVRNGDVQKSRAFLKTVSPKTLAEEELNYQGFNNMNSVSIAIAMGQVPMLKYLVEERNIPLQSCKKRPLEIAAEYGHVNVLKYLVERGEDLFEVERANEPYTNGLKSILEVAVINGHLGVVYPILVHLENTGFPVMVRDEVLANEVIKINATILKTVKELPVKSSDNAVPTELMVLNKSVEKRARFLHCVEHRMKMEFIKMFLENPDLITMTDIDDPSDTLAHFCAYSQQHMMDLVLDFGGDGCKYNSKGIRPIHFAVAMNNNDALKSLLKVGEDPNVRALNDDHYTPLLIAVTISTQTVQILLDHGADPCLAGVDGLEPIHVAAKIGHSHTVELLKIAGANINSVANGYTPLHYAIQENMLETVLCFLRLGADTKVLTPNKKTLVQYAESLNAHPNIIGLLAGKVAVPKTKLTSKQIKNFVSLLQQGELTKCETMMRENIEYVVCRGENDYPAILTASMLNVNTIKCLLSHGASPISPAVARPAHYALMVGEELFSHLKSVGGLAFETLHAYGQEDLPFPVLDFTVVLGTSEALATAHKYGCKPTQRNSLDTKSLLEHAVENGKVDSLETLLRLYKNEINVNEITYRGYTALHTAADSGKLGCVVQLLHNGADHTIKNKQGLTALDLAIINNQVDTIKVLENHAKGIKTLPLTKEEAEAYADIVLESELVVGNTLIDKYEENPLYKLGVAKAFNFACMYNFYDVFAFLIETTRPSVCAAVELQPPMLQATAAGATEIVNEMIMKDFDPDVADISSENTPLHHAIKEGNVLLMRVLLTMSKVINPCLVNGVGMQPIHLATNLGDKIALNTLLDESKKVDINARIDNQYKYTTDKRGYTPLHLAIENGDIDMVICLIRSGADITLKTPGPDKFIINDSSVERTCLDLAKKTGIPLLIKIVQDVTSLVQEGLDPDLLLEIAFSDMIVGETEAKEMTWEEKLNLVLPEELQIEDAVGFVQTLRGCMIPQYQTQQNFQMIATVLAQNPSYASIRDLHTGDTPLHLCASLPPPLAVELLNLSGYHIYNRQKRLPIHEAAKVGNNEMIKLLIDRGQDVNDFTGCEEELTPLMIAIQHKRTDTVRFLINNCKADIFLENTIGATHIHMAASFNSSAALKILVEKGENVNRRARGTHFTPLHTAVTTKSVASVIMLLSLGAKPNTQSSTYSQLQTPVDLAKNVRNKTISKIILDLLDKAEKNPRSLPKPLTANQVQFCAQLVEAGQTENVLQLLNSNIEYAFVSDDTPLLHRAVTMNNRILVKKLLEMGTDPTCETVDGVTPMHVAAVVGPSMIEAIAQSCPDVLRESTYALLEGSPLHTAVIQGNIESVKCFLKHEVHPTVIYSKMGMTPVHLAAQYDDVETIKLFYEGLPEKPTSEVEKFMVLRVPGRNDHYGYMPLHTAIHSSALRVAEYLLEKRAPVRCSHEFIPLSALIAFNRNDTMEKMRNLVDKYVSKEISDNMGNMSKKTIFCDIDIIASNHTMVVSEKPISQEEKTQKKMIEQFNEMSQQQRYNWCTQIGLRLEKTLGSTKFAKDEQFAKNVAAVLEQAPISADMSEDHRNVQTNILTAAYYLVAASRQVVHDYREAITWASKAIRVNKYFAQAYQVRGSSYEQLGDIQSSQRDLEIYMQLIQQF